VWSGFSLRQNRGALTIGKVMQRVEFTNTVLRDGHQSLAATRMRTEQMLPALADLDALGFYQMEAWGGATIDACLRYLGQNPFECITALKRGAPQTPHSMLLRGQNIVQYPSFADDVVEAFVNCTARRGMDVLRIFAALNDARNLEVSIRAILAAGTMPFPTRAGGGTRHHVMRIDGGRHDVEVAEAAS
jgi:oxaloacetate decarboxylase alpha subunit/pyruvate carboxylase subunit B